jgi:cell division protein FtsQ
MPRDGRKPKKRWPVRTLFLLGSIAAFAALAAHIDTVRLRLETFLPVAYVRVEGGLWHLDVAEFRKALLPYARGGYFTADLDGIEAEARHFAWVDKVWVARVWPDTLLVRIEEHKPVARWGEDSLLNERGERFSPPDVALHAHLPLLSGPAGQEKPMLDTMRALNAKLQPRQMRIESLRLSKRRAWVAQLADGMEIVFGNQDPLAALDRLLTLLPRLGDTRIAAIRKLDLRYPNGFSVVWKPEFQAPPDSLSRVEGGPPPDTESA